MASFPRHHLKTFRLLATVRTSAANRFFSAIGPIQPPHRHQLRNATASGWWLPAATANLTWNKIDLTGNVDAMRRYSSERRSLPTIMDFQTIVWPSVFKSVRNWIMVNFIIRPYFDQDFNLPDFVAGTKQAVELVSGRLATLDVHSLAGLVATEAIDELRGTTARMSVAQRNEIPINKDDIYLSFPYQVGIIFDESNEERQKRWVEITMVFHVLRGLQEMRENGIVPPLNIG